MKAAAAKGEKPVPPRRDLRLETLADVLDGKILVHAHCYRADEILMLIKVADEFGFKVRTFQHVLEGYKVASEIARHGAGVGTFIDWWAYKMEAIDAIPYNAAILAGKGVLVSLNSDSDELARRLYWDAAKAVKYGGVSEEEALKMITLNPARQLGVDSHVGSLEPGKDADLAIFSGHPLSPTRPVRDDAGRRAGVLRPREGPRGPLGRRRLGRRSPLREVRGEARGASSVRSRRRRRSPARFWPARSSLRRGGAARHHERPHRHRLRPRDRAGHGRRVRGARSPPWVRTWPCRRERP